MSGATNKVSLIEKVVALLAPLNEHVERLPELEAARKCASLAPKLSTDEIDAMDVRMEYAPSADTSVLWDVQSEHWDDAIAEL